MPPTPCLANVVLEYLGKSTLKAAKLDSHFCLPKNRDLLLEETFIKNCNLSFCMDTGIDVHMGS